ncbi:hypothetical protein V8C86DRAFT_2725336 [Haematococcus lacustris]
MRRIGVLAALVGALIVGPSTGASDLVAATSYSASGMPNARRQLKGSAASPDAAAGARPCSISVAMDLVVGPEAAKITFLPKPTFGYAYAPLQLTVPATASSALANLAVINLGGPTSSSLPPGADSGGQPLTRGQVWQAWVDASDATEAADDATLKAINTLFKLSGMPNRSIRAGRDPSTVTAALSHAVDALLAATRAANATLAAADALVEQVTAAAELPGDALANLQAWGGGSIAAATGLSASAAYSALAAGDALCGGYNALTMAAAQHAAEHAAWAARTAPDTSDAASSSSTPVSALNVTAYAGHEAMVLADAIAQADFAIASAAQQLEQADGKRGEAVLRLATSARTAATSAATAAAQIYSLAQGWKSVPKPARSRNSSNSWPTHNVTFRVYVAVAQSTAAASSSDAAAMALLACASLVAQVVLPSRDRQGDRLNDTVAAGMLGVAWSAAQAAAGASDSALVTAKIAASGSQSPPGSPSTPFTPLSDALYATGKSASMTRYAWTMRVPRAAISVGLPGSYGYAFEWIKPVALVAGPNNNNPATLVAVRDIKDLPPLQDASAANSTSFFDNSTGAISSDGTVWLDPTTSVAKASALPGIPVRTRPLGSNATRGLSGDPLGSDVDRLMLQATADTRLTECYRSASSQPWRAWVADHSLVSAAPLPATAPLTSLTAAHASHASALTVLTLQSHGTFLARSYNPIITTNIISQGRWAMCGSFLQLKAEHSVARLVFSSDTAPRPLTYVGSNSWPITASYKLQRVPNSNDQTAPAVLLLSGAPFFVVPDLLITDALGA